MIFKMAAVLLGSAVLLTSCIEETFPESSYATNEQVANSPFATGGIVTAMPTILMNNYTGVLGEHVDFGYGGIFGALDRLAGEIFPVAGNMPGGNQYYDRWQFVLYPANTNGLGVDGWGTPFFYYSYYQYIYTANAAIEVFSAASEPTAELGIAKVFRALSYMDMARLYDPLPAKAQGKEGTNPYEVDPKIQGLTVPIVREGMALSELENNPRTPREQMWAFILNDLNEAETLLADYKRTTMTLPNLSVVYGMKARAYLWLGGFTESYGDVALDENTTVNVPTGAAAYKLAAEYARKAINASGATILTEAEYLDRTNGFSKVASSWMWALCQSVDTIINNLYSWTAHMSPDGQWGYGPLAQPGMSVLLYDRMSDTDFRKKIVVNKDRDFSKLEPYVLMTEEEFEDYQIAPMCVFKFHTGGGEKYDDARGNVTDIPLMRVEEMYLIEAEATAHADAATGKTMIANFMAHRDPNYSFLGSDVIDEIIFQKRIELWGEGQIIYDLKRLNVSLHNGDAGTNAPSMDRFTTDGRAPWWNLCLPLSAVQQNKGLDGFNNPTPFKTYLSNEQ